MKIVVLGGTGMVGSEFVRSFRKDNHECWAVARNSAASRLNAVSDEYTMRCDILDRDALTLVFERLKPDVVIHMAAQAFNGISWEMEYLTHQTNYVGTWNVLDVARKVVPNARILLACSSAEYGNITPDECPLIEDRPLKAHTPYGVSKVGTEQIGLQFALNYDMQVFLPRMFIHVGVGHPPATAIQNFARQLALMKSGLQKDKVLHTGNLETERDYIDVRDGVKAMRLVLDSGDAGKPYNICNNKAYKIKDVLEMLIDISGLSGVEVKTDPSLLRKADELLLMGNNERICALGYEREYSMEQTLKDVFDDWMGRI